MSRVDWAYSLEIPHAEKLTLVYLAHHANTVGIGRWNRRALSQATGYKQRSMQRLLKSLRDLKLLIDHGEWYQVALAPIDTDLVKTLPAVELHTSPQPAGVVPYDPNLFADLANEFVDQLANFEMRMDQRLERMVIAAPDPAATQEPYIDPVTQTDDYHKFLALGMNEVDAYGYAKKLIEQETVKPEYFSEEQPLLDSVRIAAEDETGRPVRLDAVQFTDDADGRCKRVAAILNGGSVPHGRILREEFELWQRLEAGENRHTVKGETDAFELLYPAIVEAARRNVGMELSEFIDPAAAEVGKAPWDADPKPTAMEDRGLEREIGDMLQAIEQANDPNCHVQPRVVQKNDDGSTTTETIVGYHRRVKRVYEQLQHVRGIS